MHGLTVVEGTGVEGKKSWDSIFNNTCEGVSERGEKSPCVYARKSQRAANIKEGDETLFVAKTLAYNYSHHMYQPIVQETPQ